MKPLTDEERQELKPTMLTLRIIVFALCMGVGSFAAISIYQKMSVPPAGPQPQRQQFELIHIIAILFAAGAGTIALVLPPFLGGVKANTSADNRDSLIRQAAAIVQQRTIVACALLEGAAFFNIFCYFTDASVYNLAMAGILLLLIVSHFPLSGTYCSKIERIMGVDPFAVEYS